MKLRNKRTGEIGELLGTSGEMVLVRVYACHFGENPFVDNFYKTLSELKEEWEDVSEEPKEYWAIDWTRTDGVSTFKDSNDDIDDFNKSIGNYFETKEEAEKAVEKLEAFKRLKDKGFEFRWIDMQTGQIKYSFFLKEGQKVTREDEDDLLALFGGEE